MSTLHKDIRPTGVSAFAPPKTGISNAYFDYFVAFFFSHSPFDQHNENKYTGWQNITQHLKEFLKTRLSTAQKCETVLFIL